MKSLFRITLAALGIALFGWFIRQAGLSSVAQAFARLGACAPLLLVPSTCVYLLDTLGWTFAFAPGAASALSFRTRFRIRTAGEAVNNLVPSAYLGGEPVKVYLAAKYGVASLKGAQSVVVAKTTMTLAELLFIVVGATSALATLPPGSRAYRTMLVSIAAVTGVVGLLLWLQHRGLFMSFLRAARRLGWRADLLERNQARLAELDASITDFYRRQPRRFFASTALHLAGWFAGIGEVWLGTYLLGMPIHWTQAVTIEAFAAVAKGAGAFAPGSIGVQESGVVVLFRIFGYPDAVAVSYAILRRGRELLWVGLGSTLLAYEESNWGALGAWLGAARARARLQRSTAPGAAVAQPLARITSRDRYSEAIGSGADDIGAMEKTTCRE